VYGDGSPARTRQYANLGSVSRCRELMRHMAHYGDGNYFQTGGILPITVEIRVRRFVGRPTTKRITTERYVRNRALFFASYTLPWLYRARPGIMRARARTCGADEGRVVHRFPPIAQIDGTAAARQKSLIPRSDKGLGDDRQPLALAGKMEAAGIEPASQNTSTPASTCVVGSFPHFAHRPPTDGVPGRQVRHGF